MSNFAVIAEWKNFIERHSAGEVTDDEMRAWQGNALRNVLKHAYEGSKFYQGKLAGIELSAVTLDTMSSLPFTTKADLGQAMYDMVCGDIRNSLYFFSTTGTTGRSTPCPRSELDFEIDNVPITFSLGKILDAWLGPKDTPVLAMVCPNETHSVCLSISFAAKELGIFKFDAFPLSPVIGFERLFELLLELKVNVIVCSPGLLMALAEMSHAYGIDVKEDLFVKCALTTGELCTPNMAHLIEQTWGARACNWWYGSQEAGTSALAAPDGAMVPVWTNHIHEVLDLDSGSSLVGQGHGELCLTTLLPGMKPLIRYRTGDLVEITRDDTGRRTMSVLGRVKDMVRIGGRLRSAAEIEKAILADHGLIYGYQLEVGEKGGEDAVVVRVKAKDSADLVETRRVVSASVRQAFGVDCRVQIVPLLDMVTATGGWVSWKTARIKDLRVDESTGIEARSAVALAQAAEERI